MFSNQDLVIFNLFKFKPEPKESLKSLNINIIRAILFYFLIKKKDHQLFAVFIKNIKKVLTPKLEINPIIILPLKYYNFLDVFFKGEVDKLPPYKPYNHTIPLFLNKEPHLKENLSKRFIYVNSLPAIILILVIKKPNKGLKFYINYRGLNNITKKNNISYL